MKEFDDMNAEEHAEMQEWLDGLDRQPDVLNDTKDALAASPEFIALATYHAAVPKGTRLEKTALEDMAAFAVGFITQTVSDFHEKRGASNIGRAMRQTAT